MPFALTAQHHRSPPAVWPFFTPQSTTPLTASPARTNLTWCKAQCKASASREAAASAAAHEVLVNLFPDSASTFDALHAAILATIPDGTHKANGIVWGEFVANQILTARADD